MKATPPHIETYHRQPNFVQAQYMKYPVEKIPIIISRLYVSISPNAKLNMKLVVVNKLLAKLGE